MTIEKSNSISPVEPVLAFVFSAVIAFLVFPIVASLLASRRVEEHVIGLIGLAAFHATVGAIVGGQLGYIFRRNRYTAAILGAFFGPIGWLLVLALTDHRRRCRACFEPVHEAASKCPHCQAEIASSPPKPPPPPKRPAPPAHLLANRSPLPLSQQVDGLCPSCGNETMTSMEFGEELASCTSCTWKSRV